MVYFLAAIANDADHMPSLLYALGNVVDVPVEATSSETWGVGYYADGRALIIRKPAELLTARSVYELAPRVKSRIVVACAQAGLAQDRSPPFRFRRWLFGFTGDLQPLVSLRDGIVEKLPDFIRTGMTEASGGELALAMYLAELYRGGMLSDPLLDVKAFGPALARTADTIARLSTESSAGPVRASYVASNGAGVIACSAGVPIAYKNQAGLDALPGGPPDPQLTEFKQIAAALKRFRAVVIARGPSPGNGWISVADGETLVIDGKLAATPIPRA